MKPKSFAVWLGLLVAALTSCDDPTGLFSHLNSELAVDTSSIVVGQRYIGSRTRMALTLTSQGNAAVRATLEPQGEAATAFEVERKVVVPAASSLRVEVDFVPDRQGELAALLVIAHDADSGSPLLVELRGLGQTPPDCNDGNPCTDDWFDVGDEQCHHQHRSGTCDDNSACTEGDTCIEGQCIGRPITCRDLVECTLDTCDPQRGCVFVPRHDQCGDGDPCTADVCNELIGCINPPQPEGTPCGPLSCAEVALCFVGQCVHAPTPDGFPCEDGDVCTTGDSCQGGVCQAGPGDPFQVVGPVEFEPETAGGNQVNRVLAVATGAGGSFDVVYQMAVLPPPEPYDDAYACECCRQSYSGGDVHWAKVTRTGAVVEDMIIGRGVSARAEIRDGVVYLVAHDPGPIDCPDQATLALTRVDLDGIQTQVRIVPPTGALADEFDLAVSLDRVAIGMLYHESGALQRPVEPSPMPDRYSVQLVLFARDLAVANQRSIALAEAGDEIAFDLQLHLRSVALDLAYQTVSTAGCEAEVCSQSCGVASRLLTDVLAEHGGTSVTVHSGSESALELSLVTATYPAGLYLLRGMHDATAIDALYPTEGVEANPGSACFPYEQIWLFSADQGGALSHTQLLDHEGYTNIASAVAIGALGRLGALLLDEQGGLEAVVPAEGFVPEVRLSLNFPAESGRLWYTATPPATRSLGNATFVAGISDDDASYYEACQAPVPDTDAGVPFVPPCAPRGRRIVIAGAGCGVGL
ncbi:MAG: hypothetical protein JXR83_20105 [Deltaproteobacteria bacterium]|nr:hypothetical protein [Deltaproteobacteria bacterium]